MGQPYSAGWVNPTAQAGAQPETLVGAGGQSVCGRLADRHVPDRAGRCLARLLAPGLHRLRSPRLHARLLLSPALAHLRPSSTPSILTLNLSPSRRAAPVQPPLPLPCLFPASPCSFPAKALACPASCPCCMRHRGEASASARVRLPPHLTRHTPHATRHTHTPRAAHGLARGRLTGGTKLFNVFHPTDPFAYRFEPLLDPAFAQFPGPFLLLLPLSLAPAPAGTRLDCASQSMRARARQARRAGGQRATRALRGVAWT